MADDAGHGVEESAGKECLEGELYLADFGDNGHDGPPDNAPYKHSSDQGDVNAGNGFRQFFVKNPGCRAVSRQLEGHRGSRREKGRHAEQHKPKQRSRKSYNKPIRPSADKAAEQGGDVHRRQGASDLGNLSGQKGQHHAEREAQGGIYHIFDSFIVCVWFFLLMFLCFHMEQSFPSEISLMRCHNICFLYGEVNIPQHLAYCSRK